MKKIRTKIILLVFISVAISALIIGAISTFMIYSTNSDRIDQMEDQLRFGYDENIKHQVEILTSAITAITVQMDSGKLTKSEAQVLAADVIRNAKYGESGYF